MKRHTLVLVMWWLVAATANASLMIEDFESYSVGLLAPQSDWDPYSNPGVQPISIVEDNGPLFPGHLCAELSPNGAPAEDVSFLFDVTMGPGDRWFFGMDMKVEDLDQDVDYFTGFKPPGSQFLSPRLGLQKSGSGFNFGLVQGFGGSIFETETRFFGEWYRVVGMYEYDSGAAFFWAFPWGTGWVPDVLDWDLSADYLAAVGFREIALRQGSGLAHIRIDNITATQGFYEAVPEPATLSLLALGGLVAMRRRR